jgi:hypothetical protein
MFNLARLPKTSLPRFLVPIVSWEPSFSEALGVVLSTGIDCLKPAEFLLNISRFSAQGTNIVLSKFLCALSVLSLVFLLNGLSLVN